jgi:hypothetical protein
MRPRALCVHAPVSQLHARDQFSYLPSRGMCKILGMPILSWIAARITGEALKAGGEVFKTATEIPKNIIETEKAHLEVEELKFQTTERQHLITPATFEDVEQYDPKVERLYERLERFRRTGHADLPRIAPFGLLLSIVIFAGLLFPLAAIGYWVFRWVSARY